MEISLESALGLVLKQQREQANLSQEKLAELAGLDRSYVSIVERGLKSPTVTTLEKLSVALKTLPEKLLAEARAQRAVQTGGRGDV